MIPKRFSVLDLSLDHAVGNAYTDRSSVVTKVERLSFAATPYEPIAVGSQHTPAFSARWQSSSNPESKLLLGDRSLVNTPTACS